MCWSGPASAGMASLGFAGSIYAKWKGEGWMRWSTLAYFSTMELLQAITYSVIGICALSGTPEGKINETLTILSYLHICFQPIMTNLFGLSYSVKKESINKWLKITFPVIIVGCFLMVFRLFPSTIWGLCNLVETPLCGNDICSYPGNWHIAWRLTLNGFDEWSIFGYRISWLSYNLPVFILPIFYGGWRWSLYHFVFGIFLAMNLTSNKDEFPAIWCLSSIAFLMATHIPFVHKWLETPIREDK